MPIFCRGLPMFWLGVHKEADRNFFDLYDGRQMPDRWRLGKVVLETGPEQKSRIGQRSMHDDT